MSLREKSSVETVAKLEEEFLDHRSAAERATDAFARFVATPTFLGLQVIIWVLWIVVNEKWISWAPAFDPFPYPLLVMLVSMEAVVISTVVLMKQNRMSERAEHRDHLNLQVDILSEKEATKILQILVRMASHLGLHEIAEDKELADLSKMTALEKISKELKETLQRDDGTSSTIISS